MKILKLLPFFILCITQISFSQETDNSIEAQFTDVIEKSNRYQDFKVVKITKLTSLQKNVSDSIIKLKNDVKAIETYTVLQQKSIDSLSQRVNSLAEALTQSQKKENGISFFGSIIKKSVYNTIMWSIILGLAILSLIFMFRFKRSNDITKEANTKLSETEEEYEDHRRKALEREQLLRRKLQDELNKQKKS